MKFSKLSGARLPGFGYQGAANCYQGAANFQVLCYQGWPGPPGRDAREKSEKRARGEGVSERDSIRASPNRRAAPRRQLL